MNKKGVGPIGAIFLFIVFIVMWFVWLAGWINEMMAAIIIQHNLTGIEAFALSNFNFIIFICMLLGMLGWSYFGGGQ